MELVKPCPACGEENPVSEVICRVCMTNLSSVSPVPPGGEETPGLTDSERTMVSRPAALTLSRADGRCLAAADGDVLGREGETRAFFEGHPTVSRRHAKVTFSGGWRIEDLDSTNGTWLNGRRLEPGPHPLKDKDTVSLSLACELKVVS